MHDNDGVARKIIEESKWDIEEALDPGHAINAIKRNLINFNKRNQNPFPRLVSSISRYLEKLLRDDKITKDERLKFYNNIPNHYLGFHDNCSHPENIKTSLYKGKDPEKFQSKLKEFLKENIHYPQKVQPKLNTQNNECFNKLKTKYLRKDFKFSTSTELRYSLAILDWNEDGC